MTKEKFDELVDYMIEKSGKTLKEKNAKYAPENDALHNFHYGAQMDNSTTAQTIWHYWKKHLVALMDKINRDDWKDLEDAEEKIQDSINYLLFIWCAANEANSTPLNEAIENNSSIATTNSEPCCTGCEHNCSIEEAPCDCCKYGNLTDRDYPCNICKHSFLFGSPEYLGSAIKFVPKK